MSLNDIKRKGCLASLGLTTSKYSLNELEKAVYGNVLDVEPQSFTYNELALKYYNNLSGDDQHYLNEAMRSGMVFSLENAGIVTTGYTIQDLAMAYWTALEAGLLNIEDTVHYLMFDGVSSFGEVPEMEFDGDFSVTVGYRGLSDDYSVILSSSDDNYRIRINPNGSVNYRDLINSISLSSVSIVNDNESHMITLSMVDNTLSIILDGEAEATTSVTPIDSIKFNTVGALGSLSDKITAIVWSLSATGITNTDAYPTGTAHWAISDKGSDIQTESDNSDWAELWTFGDASLDGTASSYSVIAGSTSGVVPLNTQTIVEMSYTNVSGGKVELIVGTSSYILDATSETKTGSIKLILNTGTNTRCYLQDRSGGTSADLITLSIKQTTAMLLNNVDHDTDWYDVINGFILGPELVTTKADYVSAGNWQRVTVGTDASFSVGDWIMVDGTIDVFGYTNFVIQVGGTTIYTDDVSSAEATLTTPFLVEITEDVSGSISVGPSGGSGYTSHEDFSIKVVLNPYYYDIPERSDYYLMGDGVATYASADPMEFEGNQLSVSFKVRTTQIDSDWAIAASNDFVAVEGEMLIYMDNPDGLNVIIGNGDGFARYVLGGQEDICNGELNEVLVSIDSDSVSYSLNGTTQNSVDRTDSETLLSLSGHFFGGTGGRYFEGLASDLVVKDTSTGKTLLHSFLDRYGSDTQINLADDDNPITLHNVDHDTDWYELVDGEYLGGELVVNGDFSDGETSWTLSDTTITSGQLVFDEAPLASQAMQAGSLSDATGKTFKMSVTVSDYVTGSVRVQLESAVSSSVSENGVHTFDIAPTIDSPRIFIRAQNSTNTFKVDSLSVKEILNP